jgi:hypothetical protein
MEIYLLGVYVALLINLVALVIQFFTKFGVRTRNFSKTGAKYFVVDGTFQENPRSWFTTAFIWINLLIISPLTSWFHVLWWLGFKLYAFVNRVPVPEKIKELQYQLAASELPKDKVLEILNQIAIASGKPGIRMPGEDENSEQMQVRKGLDVWMDVDRDRKQFTISQTNSDTHSWFYSVHEYKFDETNVFERTLEKWADRPETGTMKEYDIKDNVVLESEILEREKDRTFSLEQPEEKIEKLKKAVAWKKLEFRPQAYFILSRHQENLPPQVFRSFMRNEQERIKNGIRRLKESFTEPGWELTETDEGWGLMFPAEKNTDQEIEAAAKYAERMTDEGLKPYGLAYIDVWHGKEILSAIDGYLAEKT